MTVVNESLQIGGLRKAWTKTGNRWPSKATRHASGPPGRFHPHFHVLLVVPGAYLEPHSPLYITQADWAAMWRKAAIAGSASDSGHAERWLENAHEGTV